MSLKRIMISELEILIDAIVDFKKSSENVTDANPL